MHIPKSQTKNFSLGIITIGGFLILLSLVLLNAFFKPVEKTWDFQSIDTMKYSRDLARQTLDSESFIKVIDLQIKEIAETGATHVAIATPYDQEFVPVLRKWVVAARKNNLKIWFRGNFSGWEGWFDYPKIDRVEHIRKTQDFIKNNSALFVDGDIFTACPECENGGPGDPRRTGDVVGHREFLIQEYNLLSGLFADMGKDVKVNYNSMNYDVAMLVMDPETTRELGGVVTIDHYVKQPTELTQDIDKLAQKSGGKVVVGEFGAPIPDITGPLSEVEQQEWIKQALLGMSGNRNVIGVNYWVNTGGSTELWDKNNKAKAAVKELKSYYSTSK